MSSSLLRRSLPHWLTIVACDGCLQVVNAGCADKDLAHFDEQIKEFTKSGKDVHMERLTHFSLLALQGPKAADALARHTTTDLSRFSFFDSRTAVVAGLPCIVTRCGYTGEDGFEVSAVASKHNHEQFVGIVDCLSFICN
jgi:aminomethyltransferase